MAASTPLSEQSPIALHCRLPASVPIEAACLAWREKYKGDESGVSQKNVASLQFNLRARAENNGQIPLMARRARPSKGGVGGVGVASPIQFSRSSEQLSGIWRIAALGLVIALEEEQTDCTEGERMMGPATCSGDCATWGTLNSSQAGSRACIGGPLVLPCEGTQESLDPRGQTGGYRSHRLVIGCNVAPRDASTCGGGIIHVAASVS